MRLLRRYYIKIFLTLYLIISIGLSMMMSGLDLIEKIDELLPLGVTFTNILLYGLYGIPRYLSYVMPFAGLISGLYTLGQASKKKEIISIMAGGGRIKSLLLPFIVIGIMTSLISFALSEFLVPEATISAKKIRRVGRPKGSFFKEGTIWLRAKDGSIVRMGLYLPEKDSAKKISIFRLKETGLAERIEAETAIYSGGRWLLQNTISYDIEEATIKKSPSLEFPHIEPPTFLEEDVRSPDEMGILELKNYLKKLRQAGLKNLKLEVDMQAKLSYPLINLFMLIIGISFSVRRGLGGLLAGAAGISISLLYWIGFTVALSLGYAGVIPPQASAWLMPTAFCTIAIYLFLKIPE